jgi:uncharacterized SAM-binding protein YcdF (DUF218 family)
MLKVLRLKTVLKTLILPPAGPLLLAMVGVFLMKRRPRLGRACVIAGLGSLWLLGTPLVSDAITRRSEYYPPLDLQAAAGAQAIVVLGGGGQRGFAPEYGGPAAEPYLLERLSYGAYLAGKTGLPVLVTGFEIEAAAMRATLQRNFGIEPRWIDANAYDTFENARNSVQLLKADGVRRIVLVTRASHMRRSVAEFKAAGVEVVPAPVGMLGIRELNVMTFLPNPDALLRACSSLNELLGEPMRAFLAAAHLRRQ